MIITVSSTVGFVCARAISTRFLFKSHRISLLPGELSLAMYLPFRSDIYFFRTIVLRLCAAIQNLVRRPSIPFLVRHIEKQLGELMKIVLRQPRLQIIVLQLSKQAFVDQPSNKTMAKFALRARSFCNL